MSVGSGAGKFNRKKHTFSESGSANLHECEGDDDQDQFIGRKGNTHLVWGIEDNNPDRSPGIFAGDVNPVRSLANKQEIVLVYTQIREQLGCDISPCRLTRR